MAIGQVGLKDEATSLHEAAKRNGSLRTNEMLNKYKNYHKQAIKPNMEQNNIALA